MNLLRSYTRTLALCLLFAASVFAAPRSNPPNEVADLQAPYANLSVLNLGLHIRQTQLDCSHFVHYVFALAGRPFDYTPSRDLFDGAPGFLRVSRALPGDLIVWRGHVGIIVDPVAHTFLSSLNSGVKVAKYDSSYWRRRGRFHVLRYMGSTAGSPDQLAQPAE